MTAGVVRYAARTTVRRVMPAVAFYALAGMLAATAAPADNSLMEACFGDGSSRRIEGCSELLALPGLNINDKSLAHAMRGLAYSLEGRYEEALPDYDMAIRLDPFSAMALNNRAWTYFKTGDANKGLPDVERALALTPDSPHALDTRAHIHQLLGQPTKAYADYTRAMHMGGARIVKLYQCGLKTEGLYHGEADGLMTPEVLRSLQTCVQSPACDPLPPGDDCNYTTS